MSQPLEKIRETVAVRARPRSVRIDTRTPVTASAAVSAPAPVLAFAPRVDAYAEAQQALRAKSWFLTQKRWLDLIIASAALMVLSPVLLLLALAIKTTSKGPALFEQTRYGRDNIPFTLYKFRSMYVESQDISGIAHTVERDPRITAVGRIIRRAYIDELPQLINVLKGDMSIVGPRAQVMGMRAVGVTYEELVPNYRVRHAVRPGMTGLAQVRGYRGEIKDTEHAFARVEADLEYIHRANLWLDLKILALTVPSVVVGGIDC